MSEDEAQRQGIEARVAKLPMSAVLRTHTIGETQGFMKALIAVRDDRILGFTMIGTEAGEVMAVVQMVMLAGLPYMDLRDAILAHPTMAEGTPLSFLECAVANKCQHTELKSYGRGDTMKATQMLHDLGQSLWLDNITRDLLNSGTLKRYIDELSVTGLTSNPTIFDHAIKNSTAYDAAIREKLDGRQVGREAVLRTGAGGPHAGRRPVPADPRPHGRRGRLGVAGSLAAAGPRHRQHARRRPRICIARAQTAQSLHQDSGHQRRSARDRGGDLRRRADQRHSAVLREQYVAAAEAYHARHRAAHRRGLEPRCRLRGLGLHQPLGRRGGGQGAGGARQPARHRHRQAHLQGLSRAAEFAALAARLQCRRAPATPAVGQHRNQGPQGFRRPLRQGPGRTIHREHYARRAR